MQNPVLFKFPLELLHIGEKNVRDRPVESNIFQRFHSSMTFLCISLFSIRTVSRKIPLDSPNPFINY